MYKIQLKQPALIERYEFSKNSNPILRKFYKKSTINKKYFNKSIYFIFYFLIHKIIFYCNPYKNQEICINNKDMSWLKVYDLKV